MLTSSLGSALRKSAIRRRSLIGLLSCFLGLAAVELALSVGIEWFWTEVRDDHYAGILQIVRDRHREMPDRPLTLFVGSSSTVFGLDADRMSDSSEALVINCGTFSSGPISHQILLRRLLDEGIRPDLVFLEILPQFLACARGESHGYEEHALHAPRLRCEEVPLAASCCNEPWRFVLPWMKSRLMPTYDFHDQLRSFTEIDLPPNAGHSAPRSGCGTVASVREMNFGPDRLKKASEEWMAINRRLLEGETISDGAVRSTRELFLFCRDQKLHARLLVPPMHSSVEQVAPEPARRRFAELTKIADECGMPWIDARTWLDDADFVDGVHAQGSGMRHYTDRLQREALEPALAERRRETSPTPERIVPADPVSRSHAELP